MRLYKDLKPYYDFIKLTVIKKAGRMALIEATDTAAINAVRPPQPTSEVRGEFSLAGEAIHWTAEIPQEPVYPGVAHFISGFFANKQSSRSFRRAAARAGIPTVTYSPARRDGLSIVDRIEHPQDLHLETQLQLSEELLRSDDFSAAASESRIDPARKLVVAHSMGGLCANAFAEALPDQVDGIFNLATVGYGQPTPWGLIAHVPGGVPGSLLHEFLPAIMHGDIEVSWRNFRDEVRYIISDFSRPFCEGWSCIWQDETGRSQKLRRNQWLAYLAFKYDVLVPPDPSMSVYFDRYHIMPNAGHLAPQCKASRVVGQMMVMLNDMSVLPANY